MKLFDVGQEAHGVIAIGQFATGVFAFGQIATGVVAIGQVARGVFVVGQVAIGVLCVGQLVLGLHTAIGMLGVAGRFGKGLVLTIFPRKEKATAEEHPPLVPASEIVSGARDSGWSRVRVALRTPEDGRKQAVLLDEKSVLPIEPEEPAAAQLVAIGASEWPVALVMLAARERPGSAEVPYREAAPAERHVVCFEARPSPRPPWTSPSFWALGTLRLVAFAAMCVGYWYAVVTYLIEMLATG